MAKKSGIRVIVIDTAHLQHAHSPGPRFRKGVTASTLRGCSTRNRRPLKTWTKLARQCEASVTGSAEEERGSKYFIVSFKTRYSKAVIVIFSSNVLSFCVIFISPFNVLLFRSCNIRFYVLVWNDYWAPNTFLSPWLLPFLYVPMNHTPTLTTHWSAYLSTICLTTGPHISLRSVTRKGSLVA